MRNLKVSAAVSAALFASSGAYALNQADTAAAPIQLVVAGASAARDTFQLEFTANCQPNTINVYRATPTSGQDFRAYSCTLLNAAPVPVAIRNINAAVYYRSEGGSGWGPGSIAKSQQIKRLVVNANCSLGPDATTFGNCPVTGYTLAADGGTGNIVAATTDLGVSDEEPKMYRGENWVGQALGAEPIAGALEDLARSTGFGQAFGLLVNVNLPVTNISRQDAASIFAGTYTNWNQVQQADGTAFPSQTITVCRREQGSGTQVSAAAYFLNQSCGVSSEPFVVAPAGPNGNPVVENGTTSTLETCVANNAGGIGPNVFKTGTGSTGVPTGTKYLTIDGIEGGKLNAARGRYGYWFESSFSKRPGLAGAANTLADFLINRARAAAGIPGASASAFAVPGIAGNAPVLPVAASGVPVAVASKNGDSCKTPLGLN